MDKVVSILGMQDDGSKLQYTYCFGNRAVQQAIHVVLVILFLFSKLAMGRQI